MRRAANIMIPLIGVITDIMRINCIKRVVRYTGYIWTKNVGNAKPYLKSSLATVQQQRVVINNQHRKGRIQIINIKQRDKE